MASARALQSKVVSPIVASSAIRRRLTIVGAFCVLGFGVSKLYPAFSSSTLRSSGVRSPSVLHSRSEFGALEGTKSENFVRMEGSSVVVPSIVVYVTVPDRETGKKLAQSIVKEKLAACVNIVPGIESVYQWKGEIQTDAEELLIIKTRQSLLEALTEHVKANHPYDVPEVIALPINGGSPQYLEWIKDSTRD